MPLKDYAAHVAYVREQNRKKRKDPEYVRYEKESRKEYNRKYMKKKRQDPVRYAKMLEDRRVYASKNREKLRAYGRSHKEQHRNAYLRRKYGLSHWDIERMFEEQGKRCAICGCDLTYAVKREKHVDHDHNSGAVRGILCRKCNTGVGMFCDNPASLRAAADYLERAAKPHLKLVATERAR